MARDLMMADKEYMVIGPLRKSRKPLVWRGRFDSVATTTASLMWFTGFGVGSPLTLIRKLDHAVLETRWLLQPGLGRLFGKLSRL